jgi:hypothetical protein
MRSCMRAPPGLLALCLTVTGSVLPLVKPGTLPPCGRGGRSAKRAGALAGRCRHSGTGAGADPRAHTSAPARRDRIGTSRAPGAAHLSQVWHLAKTHRLGRLRQRRYSVLRPGRNHSLLALVSGAYEDRQLVRPPRTAARPFPGPAARPGRTPPSYSAPAPGAPRLFCMSGHRRRSACGAPAARRTAQRARAGG